MNLLAMLEPDQILGSTINGWIGFPPLFMWLVYLLVGALLLRLHLARRLGRGQTVVRSVALMVISTGMLHAALSDATWGQWLLADVRLFSGLSSEDKPGAIDGEVHRFISECRKIVHGEDYELYPATSDDDAMRNYFNRKLEYYLLPSRKRPSARYIVVMMDGSVFYDEKSRTFHGHGNGMVGATLLLRYGQDSYLLRKL